MIKIGNKKYKICLLDTNIISDGLKNKTPIFKNIINRFSFDEYCWALTPSTVLELSELKSYHKELSNLLALFPNIVTKGLKELKQEEFETYKNNRDFNIALFSFNGLSHEGKKLNPKAVELFFKSNEIRQLGSKVNLQETSLLELIISYKKNYPPDRNGKYSKKRIREFGDMIVRRIIQEDYPEFYTQNLSLNISHFKSLLISILFTFYKFYPDQRKALTSDLNDIAISGVLPYVDTFIAEGNMIEIINKLNNLNKDLLDVEAISIKEIR